VGFFKQDKAHEQTYHSRSESGKGVKASANLYSIIETARRMDWNRMPIYEFFSDLPQALNVDEIEKLLPRNIKAEHTVIK